MELLERLKSDHRGQRRGASWSGPRWQAGTSGPRVGQGGRLGGGRAEVGNRCWSQTEGRHVLTREGDKWPRRSAGQVGGDRDLVEGPHQLDKVSGSRTWSSACLLERGGLGV